MFNTKEVSKKVKKDLKDLSKKSITLFNERNRVEKLARNMRERAEKKVKASKKYKKLIKRSKELTKQFGKANIKTRKAQDISRALSALNDIYDYKD